MLKHGLIVAVVRDSSQRMPNQSQEKDDPDSPSPYQAPEVAVVFDVDLQDYQFTTQPGAFRRVVMNLLGNALKYTSHGYVRIKLTSTPMEDFHDVETREIIPRAMLVLTVTDTGKGIAPEFLRSKLFTPFAQENSLSSGTGLGLSIVKSIVHILEGDITIESEIGRGTRKKVSKCSFPKLTLHSRGPGQPSTPSRSSQKLRSRIRHFQVIDFFSDTRNGGFRYQVEDSRCWSKGCTPRV